MPEAVTSIDLGQGYVAIVNSDTFERMKLGRFTWRPQIHKRSGKVYAQAKTISVSLHRAITLARPGQVVDHINGDPLDNRDSNLRICTLGQNRANSHKDRDNTSGYKGVTWSATSHKWMAQIWAGGRRYYLGLFEHKKRAALAHDRAAIALHGEFAGLNFPELKDTLRPKLPA
jgi:hypothetical protein